MQICRGFLFGILLGLLPALLPARAETPPLPSAVILDWQRFSDPAALEDAITLLRESRRPVLPLADIVAAFRAGTPLPDRAVALTAEGNARSFARIAWPRFKAAGLPVTLFVTADGGGLGYAELRALKASGLSIASAGTGKVNLASDSEAFARDLADANAIFTRELGAPADLFAWPDGIVSLKASRAVAATGAFQAGFGAYGGAASAGQDMLLLPRYALQGSAAETARLPAFLDSVPLPVKDELPRYLVIRKGIKNPPAIGFTLTDPTQGVAGLNCFGATDQDPAELIFFGSRVEVRFGKPFPSGRTRLKCIMPAPGGRWYWYGRPFFVD